MDSPSESSSEAPGQRGISGIFSKQSFAMKAAGSRFLARQECCSQLTSIGSQSQCCNYPSRIPDSARRDHRQIDDVDDLRDE